MTAAADRDDSGSVGNGSGRTKDAEDEEDHGDDDTGQPEPVMVPTGE